MRLQPQSTPTKSSGDSILIHPDNCRSKIFGLPQCQSSPVLVLSGTNILLVPLRRMIGAQLQFRSSRNEGHAGTADLDFLGTNSYFIILQIIGVLPRQHLPHRIPTELTTLVVPTFVFSQLAHQIDPRLRFDFACIKQPFHGFRTDLSHTNLQAQIGCSKYAHVKYGSVPGGGEET